MGIYDSFPQLDLDNETAKKAILVILALVVIAGIGFIVFSQNNTALNIFGFLQSDPIDVKLDGPINLTIGEDGYPIKTSSNLVVTISNPENKAIEDVSVILKPADSQALIIYPTSRIIPVLDKTRTARFVIRPNPIQPALSGTYVIEIQVFIKDKEYRKLIELEVLTNEP